MTAGSISFSKQCLVEFGKKKLNEKWITLFDDPTDDEYDGDFTEDDPEMPMIRFGFKKTAIEKQDTKASMSATPAPIERNDDWSVAALKEYLSGRLEQMIESIQTDQQTLFAEEDERIAILGHLEGVHQELKGEHEQDLETGKQLKQ
jgi:hypothetical protein